MILFKFLIFAFFMTVPSAIFSYDNYYLLQNVNITDTSYQHIDTNDIHADTDSLYIDSNNINLDEVVIYAEDNKKKEKIKRYMIKRRLKRVWKYAIMTQDEFNKITRVTSKLDSKKIKKEYLSLTENFIRKNFEDNLKNMYIQDGQMLLKLIYRQTGKNAYDIITTFKSKWTVFWWNSTASFFELSLKSEYHPNSNKEDFLIEKYLQELFDQKVLERRPMFNEVL